MLAVAGLGSAEDIPGSLDLGDEPSLGPGWDGRLAELGGSGGSRAAAGYSEGVRAQTGEASTLLTEGGNGGGGGDCGDASRAGRIAESTLLAGGDGSEAGLAGDGRPTSVGVGSDGLRSGSLGVRQ